MNLQIIKDLAKKKNLTAKEIYTRIGIEKSTYYNYLSGKTSIPADVLFQIANILDVDVNSFQNNVLSEPDVLNEPLAEYRTKANAKVAVGKATVEVPLVHQYAYAGYTSGYADPEYVDSLPTHPFTVDDKMYKGKYVAFEVRGDSMYDGSIESCPDRSIVLAREVQRQHWVSKLHIHKWLFVIVHKTDGIMIKQIAHHDVDNGILTLHSLNELYEDYQVKLDDVAQIFNVVKRVLD